MGGVVRLLAGRGWGCGNHLVVGRYGVGRERKKRRREIVRDGEEKRGGSGERKSGARKKLKENARGRIESERNKERGVGSF